jgi:hypothetical protein
MKETVMGILGEFSHAMEIVFYVSTVKSLAYRQFHARELLSHLVLVRIVMVEQQHIQ